MTTYAIVEHDLTAHTSTIVTDHSEGRPLDYPTGRATMLQLARYLHPSDHNRYLAVEPVPVPVLELTCDTACARAEGYYGGVLYRVAEDQLPVAMLHYASAVVANPSDGRGGWLMGRVVLLLDSGLGGPR